jgi:hypothetical protein
VRTTGKPSAKAELAELEKLEQAAICLAAHSKKVEAQVLKDNGIEVMPDGRGKHIYPQPS